MRGVYKHANGCGRSLFVLLQVACSGKQMFVLFYWDNFPSWTTPFPSVSPLLFFLTHKIAQDFTGLQKAMRKLSPGCELWWCTHMLHRWQFCKHRILSFKKRYKVSIVQCLQAELCTELCFFPTHYSPPLSPKMGLTWQFNSGRSKIPILWMSHYNPPQKKLPSMSFLLCMVRVMHSFPVGGFVSNYAQRHPLTN